MAAISTRWADRNASREISLYFLFLYVFII